MPSKHLWLVIPLLFGACDETAGGVSQDYVSRHREAFVFRADRAAIVNGLRGIATDHGVALVEPTTGDTILTTPGEKMYESTTVYVIHVIPSKGGTLVQIVSQLHDKNGAVFSTSRATDLEWELAQRVEPDRALAITNAANDRVAPRAHVVGP